MKKQTEKIKTIAMHPLLSWGVIAERRMEDVHDKDKLSLLELKKRYQWNVNVPALLKNPYDAIVVTNIDENICWVNKGFEKMTGYKLAHVKNKKPRMLQGRNSNIEARQRIRMAIARRQPVTETVVNYRTDGTAYICLIEISPVYNFENTLTHFMALERELI